MRTQRWGGGGWVNRDSSTSIYTLPKVRQTSWWEAAAQHRELSSVLCDELEGREGGS